MSSILYAAAMALSVSASSAASPDDTWYADVIQVMADGRPLDTGDGRPSLDGHWFLQEGPGHAAPVLYDWNNDGRRDLIVGGFSGRFRVYLNEGADDAPVFGGYDWVRVGDEIALLRNFCCVATGIRVEDIDQDGVDDLTAGHYMPGFIYWFQGLEDGINAPQILTDHRGVPILTGLDTIWESVEQSLAAKPAWMDWDDDGRPDLIIGNYGGDLVVRRSRAQVPQPGLLPVDSQPVFDEFYLSYNRGQLNVFDYVEGGAGPLEDEKYLSPTTADWDRDGLMDIVIGTGSGAVYWLRNTGELGEPRFAGPEMLLPGLSGEGSPPYQVLTNDQTPTRGARASVDVVDWNGDGRLDLIVGDYSASLRLREGLTEQDLQDFEALKQRLVHLDREAGFDGEAEPFRERLSKSPAYLNATGGANLWSQVSELEAELATYFEPSQNRQITRAALNQYASMHGHVWVYLSKSESEE